MTPSAPTPHFALRRTARTALDAGLSALASALCVVALTAPTHAQQPPPPPAPDSRLTAEIHTNSDRGFVVCALFANATGFPSDGATRSIAHLRLRPARHRVTCSFAGLAPGTYAISVFHDEDSDGELDTGLFGIPTEGWGTSRNAHGTMGPPHWADARFAYRGGAIRLREPIALNY